MYMNPFWRPARTPNGNSSGPINWITHNTLPPSKAGLFQIAHQWRKAHRCRRWSDRVVVPDICLSTWNDDLCLYGSNKQLWVNE
jgi:hypothetical protein